MLIAESLLKVVGNVVSDPDRARGGFAEVALGLVFALVGNVAAVALFSGLALLVGRSLFGGAGTFGGVFRAIGYGFAPNALYALAAVPTLGAWCQVLGTLWSVALGVAAIRGSLALGTARAMGSILVPLAAAAMAVGVVVAYLPDGA